MARFTEAPANCRVLTKAAVREAGGSGLRALARADDGQLANADCRFPPARGERAPLATTGAADDGAPSAPTGANKRSMRGEAAAARPGAPSPNVARDGANGADPPGLDSPFSARAPGVPTSVSHRARFEEMDARVQVPGTAKSKIGKSRCEKMDAPWGRSLDANGLWVDHDRCRSCGCIHKRPHFSRGYCKPCFYRSPIARDRRFLEWVQHGRRLLANDSEARWLRLLAAATRKRAVDRGAGLVPDYSVIAYRVTWKLFDERCAACAATEDLTIDHHWPASAGSPIEPGNAVLLCRACNASKGARTPEEFYSAEQLARLERILRMASEFTFWIEKLRPDLDLRRLRGRAA